MNSESNFELIAANLAQKPVLANLLELYTHDFCDFLNLEIPEDGRFRYKELDLYWTDPNRHPFLVFVDLKLAGFVLVKAGGMTSSGAIAWDMAEFFILRSYRRRGIGIGVAEAVFRKFPGSWEVRVMSSNHPAKLFWQKAISRFVGAEIESKRVERDGIAWRVFSLESRT